MRLILLGPPGSGKGTQAQFISEHFGIARISTGDILRKKAEENTPLGIQIKSIMDVGSLVPDNIIIKLVRERLEKPDCRKGFVLDGFPRTVAQAEALTLAGVTVDKVIDLEVPDEAIVERLIGRRIHPASGRTYHITHNPPARAHYDDVTGEPLVQREDDEPETIRKRLSIYRAQTHAVSMYYLRLSASDPSHSLHYIKVDANLPPLAVCEEIFSHL